MNKIGCLKCYSDYSLFVKSTNNTFTAILVYVDDLVLSGNDLDEIRHTKLVLHNKFSIKDLGNLKFFLGMEVVRVSHGITFYQRKYTLDLLEESVLLGSKPASTPIEYNAKIQASSGNPLTDSTNYRRLMGKLLYLTHTRPDICFAVGCLSQFLSAPTTIHYQAANIILKYLKGSPGQGTFFPRNNSTTIRGYSDSDWATCLDTRKSVTGWCFFLGTTLVSWKGKKQNRFQGLHPKLNIEP
ncbi:PREDICTED: uncharacterized protein LOC109352892 [Lupinus angustifolius]|uniref:uncharacterized protein LOC109352892 n=1 Tax=Lupinus angustifolius TaxID=3871 RepID=UPI00092ED68F|nr:PREDICTED: uncharacterized protein LOC109352892 [Lupinus angustifolius]